jgi:sugar (pentulose or hexulose) kinase
MLLDWEAPVGRCASGDRVDPPCPRRSAGRRGGALLPELAGRFGLRKDVRIIAGAGDVLALISGAPPELGQVTCSIGTSSMVFGPLPPGHKIADSESRLYVYSLLPYPLLGGVSSTTGVALQWAWQALYEDQLSFEQAVAQGLQAPAGAGGLLFLPFLAGERNPFWNDGLAGAFYGLTLAHRRPQLMRSVLEGVPFSLRYLLDIFAELGVAPQAIALAGGGAAVAGWPQLFADICRLPVRIYAGQETVTRGLYAYARQALGDDFTAALADIDAIVGAVAAGCGLRGPVSALSPAGRIRQRTCPDRGGIAFAQDAGRRSSAHKSWLALTARSGGDWVGGRA